MSIGALLVAISASAAAALAAAADGALLALRADDASLPPMLVALRERRERTHRALAFARVSAHLAAGAALVLALALGAGSRASVLVTAALVAVLAILVSESVARSAGDALGPVAARRLHGFIVLAERLLAPVVVLGAWIDRTLHELLPPPRRDEEDEEEAAEQFRQIVAAETEASPEEETIMAGVFELADTEVKAIMVPRVDMVALDRDTPWSEVIDRVRSVAHSRLPVFVETIDNIIGVLYAKDLLGAVVAEEEPAAGWQSLIRQASFIPGTKPIDQQLRAFQSSRTHIAIVADEYGGTAGLVTIEDILEEIVGEIRDEYDEEEPTVEQEEGGKYWISGGVTLDEVSELIGVDVSREGVTTVGGLVFELLGRVPRAGESFTLQGHRVVVERLRRRRVERVYFERLPGGLAEGDDA